ncbi:MAG TPA: alginate export family protein [Candidatus Ratteibacteria bacterium]|nr:alginate export family protein [Candidatus Ratteibacteria bacterium]
MKKIITLLTAVVLVGFVVPAFSAVENVKVGGDIVIKGIYRNNFDLTKKAGTNGDGESYLYTGARVYVSAELSNNVSAMVRFINERDWGQTARDIDLDLAYIKVADLLVPGLNLTVGRQEIQIADGLVVGSQYRNANPAAVGRYYDYGLQKAFDAIKLDYAFTAAPVSICAFKAKINELYNQPSDGDLYGLDIPIKLEKLIINPYYVRYEVGKQAPKKKKKKHLYVYPTLDTAGLKVAWSPLEALSISGEYAKQFGDQTNNRDYEGWALVLGVDYKFATNMNPVVSVGYADFSGQKATATDQKAWVPVFPSNIASRVGKIAYPALFSNKKGNYNIGTGSGVRALKLGLGLQPTEKVGVSLDWFNLTADETAAGVDESVGNEIDLTISYAYSEDLTFGLELGYLMAGDYIEDTVGKRNDENAWQAIATMKVAF